jgi:hypothetical protein
MKNLLAHKWIIIIILTIAILLPTSIAGANAPAPPIRMWFRFVTEDKPYPNITTAQFFGCPDKNCKNPTLLADFYSGVNVEKIDAFDESWRLICAENRCYAEAWTDSIGFNYFRLTVSSKNNSWVTEVNGSPDCGRCSTYWEVDLEKQPGIITEDPETVEDSKSTRDFFIILSLSAIAELLVALVFGLVWKKTRTLSIPKLLCAQLFANFLSYPFVWIAIPTFGHMRFANDRHVAIVSLVALLIFSLFSIWVTRNWKTGKVMVVIATFLFILAFPFIFVSALFVAGYGYSNLQASGLPYYAVILVAELFAVFYETMMIYFLRKSEISLKQSALLCLVANVFSCVFGLLV